MTTIPRRPPTAVLRELRREVGFGCPVEGCARPYLEWHHFDPPWHVRPHHDPAGMVALCPEHHRQADAGAFTADQLRALKLSPEERVEAVRGRFNWMRNDLLAVVGGNFYIRTPTIFTFREEKRIWLGRDDDGYLLLNVRMLSASGQPRARIDENFWVAKGDPIDVESPPSGKLLRIRYDNGDDLRVGFAELASFEAARSRYDQFPDRINEYLTFPITAVEVQMTVGGTDIRFGPKQTNLAANASIRSSVFVDCPAAIGLG